MRIGINVPDELLKELKQVRPEVNVSQVCREALANRVEVARRAADRAIGDGVDEHVPEARPVLLQSLPSSPTGRRTPWTTRERGYGQLPRRPGSSLSIRPISFEERAGTRLRWSASGPTGRAS